MEHAELAPGSSHAVSDPSHAERGGRGGWFAKLSYSSGHDDHFRRSRARRCRETSSEKENEEQTIHATSHRNQSPPARANNEWDGASARFVMCHLASMLGAIAHVEGPNPAPIPKDAPGLQPPP